MHISSSTSWRTLLLRISIAVVCCAVSTNCILTQTGRDRSGAETTEATLRIYNDILKKLSERLEWHGGAIRFKETFSSGKLTSNGGRGNDGRTFYHERPEGDNRLYEYGDRNGGWSEEDGFNGRDDIRLIIEVEHDGNVMILRGIYGTYEHYDPPFTPFVITTEEQLFVAQTYGTGKGYLVPQEFLGQSEQLDKQRPVPAKRFNKDFQKWKKTQNPAPGA